ncbi:TfoX/Sxy family protein [Muriicola jejuensis]|nr:TfoX/Sxy family protein [Muriicola jejuensis]
MSEKRMFGGLAFLLRGKMTVGVIGKEMVVRIVGEKMEGILGMEGVRPMDFNKKPMKEFVFVSSEAMEHEEELSGWISLGIEHARRTLNL